MAKKEDLIYKNDDYEIYKKNVGELGDFPPMTFVDLIMIGTAGLQQWKNGGLKEVMDYETIIFGLCKDLTDTIEK